jgi:hypothetical protein
MVSSVAGPSVRVPVKQVPVAAGRNGQLDVRPFRTEVSDEDGLGHMSGVAPEASAAARRKLSQCKGSSNVKVLPRFG